MPSLSPPNIESELSYAYLHAVASRAGMACRETNRHEDSAGIDAHLTAWGPFPGGGYLTEVNLNIQLKATISDPPDDGTGLNYTLKGMERYGALRQDALATPRILVVLFLPRNPVEWLKHSGEELALRRCAYWASLRRAPETRNTASVNIHIPRSQIFSSKGLLGIMTRIAQRDIPCWEAP